MPSNQGGSTRGSDEGFSRPRGNSRSLEEQLASVTEGEGVRYAGEGIFLMAGPTRVNIPKPRRHRRRSRRSALGEVRGAAFQSSAGERDAIANLDRVVVAFTEVPPQTFKETPVSVRFADHDRSPFVVSLREITFSIPSESEEHYLLQSDILSHEPDALDDIPSLDLLEMLSSDLHVEEPDPYRFSNQFTPTKFRLAYASNYGPVARITDRVSGFFSDLFGFFQWRKQKREDVYESEPIPAAKTTWPYGRAFIVIALLMLIAMLPANIVRLSRALESKKAAVAFAGEGALQDLGSINNAEIGESIEALKNASERFRIADELLSQTNALAVGLSALIPTTRSNYRSARALLEVGSKSADAARLLAKGLDAALNESHRSVLDRLGVLAAYAEGALPLLDDAGSALANVDESVIPEGERVKMATLAGQIEDGRVAVREFVGLSELLANLLGREGQRRYLIVFQNPNELRPTGGFMGSYAELDIHRGEIKRFEIPGGGTYDLQGQLMAQIIPPEPLTLIADRWEFQDSNWSPDFPTAAKKIRYFWSKSGGYTIDGVIAVNATLMERLLALTGPIDVPELGKVIDAQNFMLETQKSVELEYDLEENKPKKILGLMGPRLIEKLKNLPQRDMLKVMTLFSEAIERKDVQIALMDEDEDFLAQEFGWSGRLKPAIGDALAVVAANIAGAKTDPAINEQVVHEVEIEESGKIVNHVTITREHTASKGELFQGVRNVTYFRVYVPRGSTLISSGGFREPEPIFFDTPREDAVPDPDAEEMRESLQEYPSGVSQWDEGDRTVFGGWSMIDPGESQELTLAYRLPFTAFDIRDRIAAGLSDESDTQVRAAYSLLLTSQAGKADRVITTNVHVPEDWETRWSHAGEGLSEEWDRDKVVSALYVTKN